MPPPLRLLVQGQIAVGVAPLVPHRALNEPSAQRMNRNCLHTGCPACRNALRSSWMALLPSLTGWELVARPSACRTYSASYVLLSG